MKVKGTILKHALPLLTALLLTPLAALHAATPGEIIFTVEAPASGSATGVFEDALRRLREASETQEITNVTLLVAPGIYWFDRTLAVTPQSVGKFRGKLVIAAAPKARPVILGSREVLDWRQEDHPLLPSAATGKVWATSLPPGLVPKTLYDAAGMLPRAQSQGFIPGAKGDLTNFSFPPGIVPRAIGPVGLELMIRPYHLWSFNILPIASIDPVAGAATTALPGTYALQPMKPWGDPIKPSAWFENHPAWITQPGNWAFDSVAGKLYLWPRTDGKPDGIRAGNLIELLRVEGDESGQKTLSGIVIRGLTFSQAERESLAADDRGLQHDWDFMDKGNAMVRLRWVRDVTVEDCTFVESGASGLRADLFAQHVQIRNNVFRGLGGGGVLLCGYGPGTKDLNKHNEVTGNLIEDCARLIRHMPGIHLWQSANNRVARNLVRDLPYTGIVVSGNSPHCFKRNETPKRELERTIRWDEVGGGPYTTASIQPFLHSRNNVVEGNEITRVMQQLGDGNGIYIRFASQTGNVIRNNYVHDIEGRHNAGGIRCDGQQSGVTIEGNLIHRVQFCGVSSNGRNAIRNNFIVDVLNPENSPDAPTPYFCGYLSLREKSVRGSDIARNVFLDTGHGRPKFYFLTSPRWKPPIPPQLPDLALSNNLYWVQGNRSHAQDFVTTNRNAGLDPGSLAVDPGMRLVNGRIVFDEQVLTKLGIKPFDWETVGR